MFDFQQLLQEQAEKMGLTDLERPEPLPGLPDLSEMTRYLQAQQERMGKYLVMSPEELSELPEYELYEAVMTRLTEKDELNRVQHLYRIASDYEMEMQNGGLCQYFANAPASDADMLPEALEALGASKHTAQFLAFLSDNGIGPEERNSFSLDFDGNWAEEYENLCSRYPFDAYDEQFYALPELSGFLTAYARANIGQF